MKNKKGEERLEKQNQMFQIFQKTYLNWNSVFCAYAWNFYLKKKTQQHSVKGREAEARCFFPNSNAPTICFFKILPQLFDFPKFCPNSNAPNFWFSKVLFQLECLIFSNLGPTRKPHFLPSNIKKRIINWSILLYKHISWCISTQKQFVYHNYNFLQQFYKSCSNLVYIMYSVLIKVFNNWWICVSLHLYQLSGNTSKIEKKTDLFWT